MIKQIRKHLLPEEIVRPFWHEKKTDRNLGKICLDKNENNVINDIKIGDRFYTPYQELEKSKIDKEGVSSIKSGAFSKSPTLTLSCSHS